MLYQKLTAKSAGERTLKIGNHLTKLEAKVEWHHFPDMLQILGFIMVALCNRADHYIFALWFLSSIFFYLLFFLA